MASIYGARDIDISFYAQGKNDGELDNPEFHLNLDADGLDVGSVIGQLDRLKQWLKDHRHEDIIFDRG